MTNFEKYREQILNIVSTGDQVAIDKSKKQLHHCNCTSCISCGFSGAPSGHCRIPFFNWLYEEYQEPSVDWSKVPVDTKVLVSDDGKEWHKRYFAEFNDGRVYVWSYGGTSWSNNLTSPYNYAKLAEEDVE